MHVISIKTGLKLAALLFLGLLLIFFLALLIYKSNTSLPREQTTSVAANPGEAAHAERALALLLDRGTHRFIHAYRDTGACLEIMVDNSLWRKLSSQDKRSYLGDLVGVRSMLGFVPEVKIIDKRTSVELSSYEHGRVILGENHDES